MRYFSLGSLFFFPKVILKLTTVNNDCYIKKSRGRNGGEKMGFLIWTGQKGQNLKWTRKEQRSLMISFCVATQKVKMHSLQGHEGHFNTRHTAVTSTSPHQLLQCKTSPFQLINPFDIYTHLWIRSTMQMFAFSVTDQQLFRGKNAQMHKKNNKNVQTDAIQQWGEKLHPGPGRLTAE